MDQHALLCLGPHGFYRMGFVVWPGRVGGRTIVCVHGLTRNGRDFDVLAQTLSEDATVLCPDMPGRGASDRFDLAEDYSYPTYLGAVAQLLTRYDLAEIDWVGTSMGGIVGMFLAAMPGTPIRRLVLNDVGPLITAASLKRLSEYVGADVAFPDLAALEANFRRIAAPFGPLSDGEWHRLAATSSRRRPDGLYVYDYDPRIANAVRQTEPKDVDLWAIWDAIKAPTLVMRGADSDLLRHEDAVAMTERGPKARLVELPGIGHAPALMAAEQIALIRDFFRHG
ncbi:MAG TPA: alpha/beta hydrolase [Stellaceae bacterium]|nr:alpha/beta hydrolase [Stellaceae bacterium]